MIVTKRFAMRRDNRQQNNCKNRGYYQSIYDRYMNTAKECSVLGDKVAAEYNMQYAEYYLRLINERFPNERTPIEKKQDQRPQPRDNQTCTIQISSEQEAPVLLAEDVVVAQVKKDSREMSESVPSIKKKRRCIKKPIKTEEVNQEDSTQ